MASTPLILDECQPNLVINGTPISCSEQFYGDYQNYLSQWLQFKATMSCHYLALAIFGQIIILSSMFANRRKNLCLSCCFGRPAMPKYGDLLLGNNKRAIWTCLHIIMTETIFSILLNPESLTMPYLGFSWIKFYNDDAILASTTIFRIAAIIFYFLFFGPLFVATADSTIFNMLIASIWVTYFLILQCYELSYLPQWFGIVDEFVPEMVFIRNC